MNVKDKNSYGFFYCFGKKNFGILILKMLVIYSCNNVFFWKELIVSYYLREFFFVIVNIMNMILL